MRKEPRYRYASAGKLHSARLGMALLFLGGGPTLIFWIFGIVVNIEDLTRHTQGAASGLVLSIICSALSAFMIYHGIRIAKRISLAQTYDNILKQDEDGYVSRHELKNQTGKDYETIGRELDDLMSRGYLSGFHLTRDAGVSVELPGAAGRSAAGGYIQVKCPNCGGVSRIRAGVAGRCEYCDHPLGGEK